MRKWLGGFKWILSREAACRPVLNQAFEVLKEDETVDRREIEERIGNVQAMFNGMFDRLLQDAQQLTGPCRAEFKQALAEFEDDLTAVVEARLLGLDDKSVLNTQAKEKLENGRRAIYDMVFYELEKEE